jgi:hypothetical protein
MELIIETRNDKEDLLHMQSPKNVSSAGGCNIIIINRNNDWTNPNPSPMRLDGDCNFATSQRPVERFICSLA